MSNIAISDMIVESIWGKKMALVIIDPQRKFSLDIPDWEDRARPAVEAINSFAKEFRSRGRPVIFIHFDGPSHTGYSGDDADSWLPGLESCDSDIVVHKCHMNCFKETDLEKVLRDSGSDCALFTGMLTEYCVISTYFAASERGIVPYLGKDALIPYNSKGNEAAELICSTAGIETVKRFLDGEQAPIRMVH